MSIQFLCPFLKLGCFFFMLSYINSFYMLGINSFSVISFASIFSHSVDCLFILSKVSFAVQKLLNLTGSCLFIFAFISFALGDRSKNTCLQFMPKSVLTMFSSRSFMVSGLTFRSLIHFELVCVCGVTECSNFILLHVACSFPNTSYWRDSFPYCIFPLPLLPINWP